MNDWRPALREDGYALFPGLIPEPLQKAARAAIAEELRDHYDPARQREYDHQSYCPELRKAPVLLELLLGSPLHALLDAVFGWENLQAGGAQIALRRARSHAREEPPRPHIDGIPTRHNGVQGRALQSFTALVGVFLTTTPRAFAGNFTVWPGSHLALERYFRARGPRALREGMPRVELGAPRQLLCAAGDAVLCHYQLAHTAAVNTSDTDRWAVYFRCSLRGLAPRRWRLLTNLWEGWRL